MLKVNFIQYDLTLFGNGALSFLNNPGTCRKAYTFSGTLLMVTFFAKLLRNEDGVTAIEYGLIAALIAVAAVTVMGTVGTNLSSTFNTVATHL